VVRCARMAVPAVRGFQTCGAEARTVSGPQSRAKAYSRMTRRLVGHHDCVRAAFAISGPRHAVARQPGRSTGQGFATVKQRRDSGSVGDTGVLAQRRTKPSAPGLPNRDRCGGPETERRLEEALGYRVTPLQAFRIQTLRRAARLVAHGVGESFSFTSRESEDGHRNRAQAETGPRIRPQTVARDNGGTGDEGRSGPIAAQHSRTTVRSRRLLRSLIGPKSKPARAPTVNRPSRAQAAGGDKNRPRKPDRIGLAAAC